MKRYLHVFGSMFFFLTAIQLSAQRSAKEGIVGISFGYNIWNAYSSVLNAGDSVTAKSSPTFTGTYDYGITHNFSVGGSVSYNTFSLINPNYSYVSQAGIIIYEPISVDLSRVNIAVRPLYHWGKSEVFEWYAGVRLGYSFWEARVNTTDPYYTDQYLRQNTYSFQALVGSRAYLSDYVAVTMEFGLFEPYIAALGISMKL